VLLTDDGFLSPPPDDFEELESPLAELPEDPLFAVSEPLEELSDDPLDALVAPSFAAGTVLEPLRLSVR
jgi:hypothetical protein